MPDQDGFTTARQLKAHPDTAGIPLMFLTGRSTVDDRLAGLRIGADDYVSKSVDPRELVLRVQKLCDRVPPRRRPPPPAAPPPPADAPARPAPTLVVSRPPDRPWLTRDAFRERVRDLAMRTWGALVLVRAAERDGVGGAVARRAAAPPRPGRRDRRRRVDAVPARRDVVGPGAAPDRPARSAEADHRRAGRRRSRRVDRARRLVRHAVRAGRPGAGARPLARPAAGRVRARAARPAPARWCCSPTTIPR